MQDRDCYESLGYIQLPVPFIRLLLVRPKEAQDIIRYCIYMKSLDCDAENTDVCRQVLYVFYHTHELDTSGTNIILRPGCYFPSIISREIIALWNQGKLELDFDRNGFGADGEFLDNSCSEDWFALPILEQYAYCNDSFSSACKQWYRIRQVCDMLGTQMEDVSIYKAAYEHYSQYNIPPRPYASIKVTMLERYRGLSQEHERVQFACFAGIKSIVGIKDYCTASKGMILARMIGKNSSSEKPTVELLNKKERAEINKIYKKYSQRRFEKILDDLLRYNYIRCCFPRRKYGYYISTKLYADTIISRVLEDDSTKNHNNSLVRRGKEEFYRKKQLITNVRT